MIAATWVWALVGVVLLLALGVLAGVALGLVGVPGDFLRRLGQTAAAERSEGGRPLPDEVPDATAGGTVEQPPHED